jgi:hypothetical protein
VLLLLLLPPTVRFVKLNSGGHSWHTLGSLCELTFVQHLTTLRPLSKLADSSKEGVLEMQAERR